MLKSFEETKLVLVYDYNLILYNVDKRKCERMSIIDNKTFSPLDNSTIEIKVLDKNINQTKCMNDIRESKLMDDTNESKLMDDTNESKLMRISYLGKNKSMNKDEEYEEYDLTIDNFDVINFRNIIINGVQEPISSFGKDTKTLANDRDLKALATDRNLKSVCNSGDVKTIANNNGIKILASDKKDIKDDKKDINKSVLNSNTSSGPNSNTSSDSSDGGYTKPGDNVTYYTIDINKLKRNKSTNRQLIPPPQSLGQMRSMVGYNPSTGLSAIPMTIRPANRPNSIFGEFFMGHKALPNSICDEFFMDHKALANTIPKVSVSNNKYYRYKTNIQYSPNVRTMSWTMEWVAPSKWDYSKKNEVMEINLPYLQLPFNRQVWIKDRFGANSSDTSCYFCIYSDGKFIGLPDGYGERAQDRHAVDCDACVDGDNTYLYCLYCVKWKYYVEVYSISLINVSVNDNNKSIPVNVKNKVDVKIIKKFHVPNFIGPTVPPLGNQPILPIGNNYIGINILPNGNIVLQTPTGFLVVGMDGGSDDVKVDHRNNSVKVDDRSESVKVDHRTNDVKIDNKSSDVKIDNKFNGVKGDDKSNDIKILDRVIINDLYNKKLVTDSSDGSHFFVYDLAILSIDNKDTMSAFNMLKSNIDIANEILNLIVGYYVAPKVSVKNII